MIRNLSTGKVCGKDGIYRKWFGTAFLCWELQNRLANAFGEVLSSSFSKEWKILLSKAYEIVGIWPDSLNITRS